MKIKLYRCIIICIFLFIILFVDILICKNKIDNNEKEKNETELSVKDEKTSNYVKIQQKNNNIDEDVYKIDGFVNNGFSNINNDSGYVYYISSDYYYDKKDDMSLQNGMRSIIDDEISESAFISYFFNDSEMREKLEYGKSVVYLGKVDDERKIVVIINMTDEGDYPKLACGFKYNISEFEKVGMYDTSRKNNPYYEMKDLEGKIMDEYKDIQPIKDDYIKEFNYDYKNFVEVKYKGDQTDIGTYNSSGKVYFDLDDMPLFRKYYYTSGDMYSFYFYDKSGRLIQYCDFGGMAVRGLEENQDISIGVPFHAYIFD